MSTPAAIAVVVAVLAVSLTGSYWAVRRLRDAASTRDRLIAEARERAGLPPAAPDNQPGNNHAWADECALIYSLPAYDPAWDAGMERLWDAIRDNQNQHDRGDHTP